MIRLQILNSHC